MTRGLLKKERCNMARLKKLDVNDADRIIMKAADELVSKIKSLNRKSYRRDGKLPGWRPDYKGLHRNLCASFGKLLAKRFIIVPPKEALDAEKRSKRRGQKKSGRAGEDY